MQYILIELMLDSLIFKCNNLHESLLLHQILTLSNEDLMISIINKLQEFSESQSKLNDTFLILMTDIQCIISTLSIIGTINCIFFIHGKYF